MTTTYAKLPIEESHWARLQDPQDILNYADNLAKVGSALADLIKAQDSRTFDSFQTGAIEELEDLNSSTRVAKKLKFSTFRFSDLKDRDTTVFLVMDNSRIESQEKVFTLITDAMLKELTRHPNKGKPVTLFMNEINNYTFNGLVSLFSWCRKYNIRLVLFLQGLSAFKRKYGEDAVNSLRSEADIKLYLPEGQRDPATQEQLEKDLGEASHVVLNKSARNANTAEGRAKIDQHNYVEEGRSLMTRDEIRRMKGQGILFLRNERPVRVYLPTIASIWPFRHQQGNNPFFKKPYRKAVSLVLLRYAPFMPAVMLQTVRRALRRRKAKRQNNRRPT